MFISHSASLTGRLIVSITDERLPFTERSEAVPVTLTFEEPDAVMYTVSVLVVMEVVDDPSDTTDTGTRS